jgi:hypothetical protein
VNFNRALISGVRAELFTNPDNPFEVWDENGIPFLPTTIDDGSPCNGVQPDPFGNTDPGIGRSLMSSLAASLNWIIGQTEHPQIPLRCSPSSKVGPIDALG